MAQAARQYGIALQQRASCPCVLRHPISARSRCVSALTAFQHRRQLKCLTSSRTAPARPKAGLKRIFPCSLSAQQRQVCTPQLQPKYRRSLQRCLLWLQDPVQQARTTQEQTTQLLAELLQAPDTAATARAHVDAIDEEFFMVSSTYLDMASSCLPRCTCNSRHYYSCDAASVRIRLEKRATRKYAVNWSMFSKLPWKRSRKRSGLKFSSSTI